MGACNHSSFRRHLAWTLLLLLCWCVACAPPQSSPEVDAWNQRSFRQRYTDIDSSLRYAQLAYSHAQASSSAWAFALNNLAYVNYQQMRYTDAVRQLDKIYQHSRDQIELLCADVMYMKVAQRTDQGMLFFLHRNAAQTRFDRLAEDDVQLTDQQFARLTYARSEYHIVSSTYYYYYGQNNRAITEINLTSLDPALQADTLQWIYYQYMLGSGGLIMGSREEVILQEFDYLFRAYNRAQLVNSVYFHANSLQALASLLDSHFADSLVRAQRSKAYGYLSRQYDHWHPLFKTPTDTILSFRLADHAIHLFASYKDLFQLACAYRTLGEICFSHQEYAEALRHFSHALSLVEDQKKRSVWDVPFWIADIHERLSMTYSALGDSKQSQYHRSAYLELLGRFSQDFELENRRLKLEHEVNHTHRSLAVLVLLVAVVSVLLWLLIRRIHRQSRRTAFNLEHVRESVAYRQLETLAGQARSLLDQQLEEREEETAVASHHISQYKQGHVERQAKVSMVYAIFPLLDRMIAEVDRMKADGQADDRRLAYVAELTQEIMYINSALTSWIQMRQGQLRLNITSFSLQPLFRIIQSAQPAFVQHGITLSVLPTDAVVKADKALTLFMINTLTENARKFTPSGGMVSLQADVTDAYVEVSISDTGVGLSEADVSQLMESKYYDPMRIGSSRLGKGFGFGIMNCKGIIAKYRKTSDRFQVCDFGVQSTEGQGSRFWFRLPRVLAVLCAVCAFLQSYAFMGVDQTYALSDSFGRAYKEHRYQDVYDRACRELTCMSVPIDTSYAIYLLNQMAVSSLSMKQWGKYRRANAECVRLHQLYTSDDSLPAYCRQMERLQSNTIFIYALSVFFSIVLLLLFFQLVLRKKIHGDSNAQQLYLQLVALLEHSRTMMSVYGRSEEHPAWRPMLQDLRNDIDTAQCQASILATCRHLTDCVEQMFRECDARQEAVAQRTEVLYRLRFEEDRLYVMNQVLDNCLSTIKHETMYYPARTQQLVNMLQNGGPSAEQVDDLKQLHSLLHFYRNVYSLLYEQAERQAVSSGLVRECVSLPSVHPQLAPYTVVGDPVLLSHLMRVLTDPEATVVTYATETSDGFVYVLITFHQVYKDEEELSQLFQPAHGPVAFLIAKQIIRDHDTALGHPGLRLTAQAVAEGYRVIFSLRQAAAGHVTVS